MVATTVLRDGTPDEVGMDPKRVQLARDLLHSHVDDGETPTLVALVARRGVIVVAEAIGTRGPGLGPVALDDVFNVLSLSKPITATLAMMLAEDGLIGINRSVVDYLPEMAAGDNERVLLHHLLTHTSGFDDGTVFALRSERIANGELTPPPEGVHPIVHTALSTTWDAPRTKDVGRRNMYCNHGYTLLGEIIRRVSGEPIDAFARRRLFAPLGMHSTGYVLDERQRLRLVHRAPNASLAFAGEIMGVPDTESPDWASFDMAGASVKATAGDLAIFGQMVLNGGTYREARILSRASVAAMTRNQIPGIGASFAGVWHREGGYGYGWTVDTAERWDYSHGSLQPVGTPSHSGAGSSVLFVDPVNDLVGVVLEIGTRFGSWLDPVSCVYERFQNVIYSAIED